MKLYSVHFIDHKNGGYNHKLLEAENIGDIYEYMTSLGHEITSIELR